MLGADAFTFVSVLAEPALPEDVTTAAELVLCVFLSFYVILSSSGCLSWCSGSSEQLSLVYEVIGFMKEIIFTIFGQTVGEYAACSAWTWLLRELGAYRGTTPSPLENSTWFLWRDFAHLHSLQTVPVPFLVDLCTCPPKPDFTYSACGL